MARKWRRRLGEWIAAYVLLAPYLFVFLVFNVFAIAYALYLSFTYFDLFSPPRWIGLGNYLYLLQDRLFLQKAVPNTLKYVAVVVPTQTIISLLLAFALDQEIKFRRFFRTLFYVPSVTSSVVISLIFLWLFKKTGVINQILGLSIDWLNSPVFALPTIMMVNIWSTTGTMMVIFLAGLQDIPVTYYEAAMIDGANRWQMLRHITIPLLRPVIFFVVTMGGYRLLSGVRSNLRDDRRGAAGLHHHHRLPDLQVGLPEHHALHGAGLGGGLRAGGDDSHRDRDPAPPDRASDGGVRWRLRRWRRPNRRCATGTSSHGGIASRSRFFTGCSSAGRSSP
jgi:multiple sugar transport system permease protein